MFTFVGPYCHEPNKCFIVQAVSLVFELFHLRFVMHYVMHQQKTVVGIYNFEWQ